MKRIIGTGLSLLTLSALAISGAKAETKIERQLQLTHPAQMTNNPTLHSPVDTSTNRGKAVAERQVSEQNAVTRKESPQLSERDRIIQEYQTQTIIRDR